MTTEEIVDQVSFDLGIPTNKNVESQQIEKAVQISFRELKRYIKTPAQKTVPYSTRIVLKDVGVITKKVLGIKPARPRIGLTMSSIDSGNVFQVAAAVNVYGLAGQTTSLNIDPIVTEMAMAQVRNTLTTDFQWYPDYDNGVIYCTHRDPQPSSLTIRYVPDYQDVSEITDNTWTDYLIRLTLAHMKVSLGRSRSKYKVEGSNVSLDGEILLDEGNEELKTLREELEQKKPNLIVVN